MKNNQQFWSSFLELPELSLAPTQRVVIDKSASSSSSAESESNSSSKKRKFLSNIHLFKTEETTRRKSTNHASVDLQLKDPLPLDWEQCLDLQSGRMYYLNKRTLRKTWEWPNDHHHHHHNHKLDLELNISSISSSTYSEDRSNVSKPFIRDTKMTNFSSSGISSSGTGSSSNNNMVALACSNCHLLVILSKSSPSCPNCKYVHSLPTPSPLLEKNTNVKSLHTLSLLN